jgi:hypothetical protein
MRNTRRAPRADPVKSEGWLIFRITEDGWLDIWGLYETPAAARERIASAGLSDEWCAYRLLTAQSDEVRRLDLGALE